jgi:hypothetical protein
LEAGLLKCRYGLSGLRRSSHSQQKNVLHFQQAILLHPSDFWNKKKVICWQNRDENGCVCSLKEKSGKDNVVDIKQDY